MIDLKYKASRACTLMQLTRVSYPTDLLRSNSLSNVDTSGACRPISKAQCISKAHTKHMYTRHHSLTLSVSRGGADPITGLKLPISISISIRMASISCFLLPKVAARASSYVNISTAKGGRYSTCCSAQKKTNFFDQILDYIEGGPKLRKWYGAAELLPKDGSSVPLSDGLDLVDEEDNDSLDSEEVRDAVLVTDGDSELGQMVILSLIVKRARVKALVKDKRAALEAFGTYVESMSKDAVDPASLKNALRGVRSVICPNEGFLSRANNLKGVKHVVLLSQLSVYKSASGIQSILTSNLKKLAEQDESVLENSGIPFTIIRAGLLKNTPGGTEGFSFEEGCTSTGSISKEDAAFICVEALDAVPQKGLVIEVAKGKESVSNWKELFAAMIVKDSGEPRIGF